MAPINPPYKLAIPFFLMISLLVGCTSDIFGPRTPDPIGDGFHTVLPKPGTHVVIWGDHSAAVTQASAWLRQQGATIIEHSRLQQAFKEHHIHPNGTTKDRARVLQAGSLIGSDLVVFLDVEKLLLVKRPNFIQAGSSPTHIYNLEVQGVDVASGETVWQGRAQDAAPPQESEALLMNLTTYALAQAWGSPQGENESYELAKVEETKTSHAETNLNSMSQEKRLAKAKKTEIEHEENSDTKPRSINQEPLLTANAKGKGIETGGKDSPETTLSPISQENQFAKLKENETRIEDHPKPKIHSISQETQLAKAKVTESGNEEQPETKPNSISQAKQLANVKTTETRIEDSRKTKPSSISQEAQLAKAKTTETKIEDDPKTNLSSIRQKNQVANAKASETEIEDPPETMPGLTNQEKIDARKPEPISQNTSSTQESSLGMQVASGAVTLLYCPAKLIYAGLGSITGGFAYLLSGGNGEVADAIWTASLQGTYVISPSHLRGDEPIYFKGVSQKKLANVHTPIDSLIATGSPHY